MVISLLYKNTLIKIKKSIGRYLSLFIIVMVGVGFFAGVQESAPDLVAVANHYYCDHNLMDFKIVSSMGLTDGDVNALKTLKNVNTVIPSYSLDVLDQNKAIRVHAIEKSVNRVQLISGRMPKTDNECIADSKAYKIGDKIRITSDVGGKLKNTEFTVVGTAKSVLYLTNNYGSTNIGDGELSSFIFINKDNFMLDAYTEIYLVAASTKNTTAYSKDYNSVASQLNNELIKIKPERENTRYQEIYKKANQEINKNEKKLNDEKAKGEKKLVDAKAKLDDSTQKLKDGKNELAKNETDLQKNIKRQNAEFESSKAKIANGWNEINSALIQNGVKKEELPTKINKLNTAIGSMKTQLSQLPSGSQEYAKLSVTIDQYSKSREGLLKLKESVDTLTAQEAKLNKGIENFNSEIKKAQDKIAKGKSEIEENEKKLKDGYAEYNKNLEKFNTEMADAQEKIDDAKKDFSDIEKTQWHIFDRDAAIGYSELKSSIDVITSIAAVFPFFFILIGMLMASNSMARMIAEERNELGILTSLGYKNSSIISTYIFYVLSASGLGATVGFFAGCRIIPPLIYSNFSNFKSNLPPLIIQYDMMTFLLILTITLALMALVTIISCNKELKQNPATLMRPVPPKNGQTIFLEKIGPIWKHLSFTWKITMRNMFRYKKRALMTIIGVSGCTSLLLVGFGLKDSMDGVAEKQYGEIFRYDDMIILKDETKNISKDLENLLTKEKIEEPLLIKQTALKCESNDKSLDAFLIVPKNENIFYKYYNLKSADTGSKLALNDNGVVITQRLSKVFKVNKGDNITVKDADNNAYQLTVADVAENYNADYIYMNNALYNKIFDKPVSYNAIVSNHRAGEKALAKHLIDSDLVLNVVFTNDMMQNALGISESLNGIIVLIVVVASLLAISVLYNLTSINISERTREIATLKVLGFTDTETNGYIYRQTFILTLISIGIGLIGGIFLHHFVIDIIEINATVFFKKIGWLSFVLACLITLIFSVIMQIITYFKLQTINMIESLKSVE
ncbi:MAG: FtsX-like permease family protein [Tissierellaceae bacterium]|nr:FtsX-like permease family protein [Tissierellaceae bacterium]